MPTVVRGRAERLLDLRLFVRWNFDQQCIDQHTVYRDFGDSLHEFNGFGNEEMLAAEGVQTPEVHRAIGQ